MALLFIIAVAPFPRTASTLQTISVDESPLEKTVGVRGSIRRSFGRWDLKAGT